MVDGSETGSPVQPDGAARVLELGLAATVILGPFPFGAIAPPGRLALELGALGLLLVWLGRSLFRPTPLPSKPVQIALAGLLMLGALQSVPLGEFLVGRISPHAVAIRVDSLPPAEALDAERRLLGREPGALDPPATLSLDPGATASALRTGSALTALVLVATTVAAICGVRRIAFALLFSAAFQGLYGLLVVAAGHDRIWNVPKRYFLDEATGTYVNPNHFAGLLAMALPCGVALVYDNLGRNRPAEQGRRLAAWFSTDGSRNWLLGLLVLIGLAGLLLSYSRAGIALGVSAVGLTLLTAGRSPGLKLRLIVTVLVIAVAVTPLMQVGVDRLLQTYANSPNELHGARARVWLDSFSLVAAQPLVGCGFGAFSASYPLVRSPEVRFFFAHVHNDLLQLLTEGGAVGLLLLLLLLIPLLDQMVRSIGGAKGTLAVGVAAGLVAVMLHSLVDFPFHMPANAAVAAILAGSLLGLPWKHRV